MSGRRKPPQRRAGSSGGTRVSGAVNVRPTLFGGSFLSITFGGGGRRGGGGLLGRLSRLVRQAAADLRPTNAGARPAGRKGGRSRGNFAAFQRSRPDLFDDQDDVDLEDDPDDGDNHGGDS